MREIVLDNYGEDVRPIVGDGALPLGNYIGATELSPAVSLHFLAHLSKAGTLNVYLHGALRKGESYPRFDRPSKKTGIESAYLSFADPTISLDSNLTLGWFLGGEDWDPLPYIAALIRRAAQAIGATRIVIIGGSGGGFAALRLGLIMPDTLVYCFNPETVISNYHRGLVKRYCESLYGESQVVRDVVASNREKFDLVWAYRATNIHPTVFYVQNVSDSFHVESHYLPFKRGLEISGVQGVGARAPTIWLTLYDGERAGHGPPSAAEMAVQLETAHRWKDEALGFSRAAIDSSAGGAKFDLDGQGRSLLKELKSLRRAVDAIQSGENSQSLRRRLVADLMAVGGLRDAPVDRRPVLSGWALSPMVLQYVLTLAEDAPDGSTVVELGSGASTVWLADVVKRRAGRLRLESFEHDAEYLQGTQELLDRAGLASFASLRSAPLISVSIDGREFDWYSDWSGGRDVSVLLVDGPPGGVGPMARCPAIALIAQRMIAGGVIVIDDYDRASEKEVVEAWLASPSVELDFLSVVDRAAVLRVRRHEQSGA